MTLCEQYGGSGAHAAVFKHQRGDWQAATRVRDKLISLRRAINNGWYDDEKQGAINLFLGHYQPCLGQSELWNLDSDHYLHSGAPPRLTAICQESIGRSWVFRAVVTQQPAVLLLTLRCNAACMLRCQRDGLVLRHSVVV